MGKRQSRSESVFWPAMWRRIIYSPFRFMNAIRWRVHRSRMLVWRTKNVDIPYRKRRRAEKRRRKRRE